MRKRGDLFIHDPGDSAMPAAVTARFGQASAAGTHRNRARRRTSGYSSSLAMTPDMMFWLLLAG